MLDTIQEKEEIDELAKIEAIEIEFVQFVLPWLKLVPPDSCCQDKVYRYAHKLYRVFWQGLFLNNSACVDCGFIYIKEKKGGDRRQYLLHTN